MPKRGKVLNFIAVIIGVGLIHLFMNQSYKIYYENHISSN